MSTHNATVIAGHLDDTQLNQAVQSLVNSIEKSTNAMATAFDNSISRMEASLNRLVGGQKQASVETNHASKERIATFDQESQAMQKSIQRTGTSYDKMLGELQLSYRKLDVWGKKPLESLDAEQYIQTLKRVEELETQIAAKRAQMAYNSVLTKQSIVDMREYTDGLTRQSSELVKLNQYYKQLEVSSAKDAQAARQSKKSYDELATSIQNVTQPKSAKDSFYAFIGNYREQAAGLAREMKSIESLSFYKQNNEFMVFERQIEATKQKIKDLREQLQLVGSNPNATRFDVKSITDQISTLETKLRQLTTEQMNSVKQIADADNQQLATKREAYNKITALIRELTQEEKAASSFSQQQVATNEQIASSTSKQVVDKGTIANLTREEADAQARVYDALNEQNRQLEIERAKTAENLELERQRQELAERSGRGASKKRAVEEYNQLNAAVAKTLGLEAKEVYIADGSTDSYNKLNNSLRMLREAYNRLSASERGSDKGREIAFNIQIIERAMQKIQRQAARPMNLQDVLGIQPKTLDDIAYKMQMLANYRSGLNYTDKNQAAEIQKVNEEYQKLLKTQNDLLGKNKELKASNDLVTRSFNYIKNRLAFYLTVGASMQFVKNLIEVRSQYEMTERALGVLVQSAERGTQIFKELSDMALVSPYTLIELSNAAKQLTAYDVAAKDVVDTTRRFADMTAAVGVPVERLTYALGQIKAYGYLNARDARMFANTGIPLVKELANCYTELTGKMVTVGDIYDKIKKKAIGYEEVMQVIYKMTDEGGRFFDYQAKVADTLKVQLANLTLAWNNMLNDMGEDFQGLLSGFIKAIKEILLQWRQIQTNVESLAIAFGLLKATQIAAIAFISKGNIALATQWVLGKRVAQSFTAIGASLSKLAFNPWTWVFAGIAALTDFIIYSNQVNDKLNEISSNIRKNASEASKSIEEFRLGDASRSTLIAANANNLDKESGEKAWENLRGEIEKSSDASSVFISKLVEISDINERIRSGFKIAQEIENATRALEDLSHIQVPQDSWLWGIFEGGISTRINDYIGAMGRKQPSYGATMRDIARGNLGFSSTPWEDYVEGAKKATEEGIKDVADEIERLLTIAYDGVFDETKIHEGVARIVKEIKMSDKQLVGETAAMFDVMLDQELNKKFPEYYSANTHVWEQFLNELKKSATHQFQDIDDAFIQGTKGLSTEQQNAIQRVIEKLGTMRPFMKEELDKIMSDLNSREFRLKVSVAFGVNESTDFQKYVKSLGAGKFGMDERYKQWLPNDTEELPTWSKRLQEENKKDAEDLEKFQRDNSEYSKAMADAIDKNTKLRNEMLKALKQPLLPESKSKTKSGSKKDFLGEAITKDIQLIQEMQKRYDEYRKMGVGAAKAQKKATEEYGKSLSTVNSTLRQYGFNVKTNQDLATMDLRGLRDYFNTILESATRLGNTKGIEAAEKAIANLNVEITKLDTKKITDGLNNDLSKLKDEYELQVELDATDGLGDALTNLLGIDTSDFPKTFQEYMDDVNKAFDEYRLKMSQWDSPWDVFKMSDKDVEDWGKRMGLDDDTIKNMQKNVEGQKSMYQKYVQDIVKQANSLEYELTDTAGKIAIKEKELSNTRDKLAKATTETEKRYLRLTIQNQEKAIGELRAQALALLPEYDRVFGSIAEHSAGVARKLQKDLLSVFDNATYDASSKSYTLTGKGGQTAILNEEQYTKERNKLIKEMRKSQSSIQKIKEAFSPSDKNDVVDYARGIELVGQELSKLSELVSAIGNITEALGMNKESKEVIDDVSQTLSGIGQAAQGYAKLKTDPIGGATDMINGTFTAISTWFDNSDKKIQRSIQNSEMAVKRLELSYKRLQLAIDDAFGTATVGAEKAALANKELQLVELKRQLTLQESRTGKKRDEEAILSLKGQITDLEHEIDKGYQGIITNILGISEVTSAVENMVSSVMSTLRSGENAIDTWNESIDDMIANMIMRFVSAQVVGPMFQGVIDDMTKTIAMRGANTEEELEQLKAQKQKVESEFKEYDALYNKYGGGFGNVYSKGRDVLQGELNQLNKQIGELEEQSKKQTEFTKQDLDYMVDNLIALKANGGDWMSYLQELLEENGLMGGTDKTQLSNLQQGIQGITETTAGALEAYCNNMLTQIYVQVGIQSRMLLELQNSYQMQTAIHNILNGVLNANGMAFRVELQN